MPWKSSSSAQYTKKNALYTKKILNTVSYKTAPDRRTIIPKTQDTDPTSHLAHSAEKTLTITFNRAVLPSTTAKGSGWIAKDVLEENTHKLPPGQSINITQEPEKLNSHPL